MTRPKYREMKDAALLRAVVTKDNGAWREFIRRFDKAMRRCVRGVCNRYRNVHSSDDIDDIMGEIYLGLVAGDMQKLRAYDETRGRRLSSWVSLLSIKMAHDYFRALRRAPQFAGLDEAEEIADPASDVDERLMEAEDHQRLNHLLAVLPANDREFMQRCLEEDADLDAFADELGVSSSSVRTRRARITTRMRSAAVREGAA